MHTPHNDDPEFDAIMRRGRAQALRVDALLIEAGKEPLSTPPLVPVYLKMAEAQQHTGRSKKVLLRAVKIGEIEAVKHGSGSNCHLHFRLDSLDRYMAAHPRRR